MTRYKDLSIRRFDSRLGNIMLSDDDAGDGKSASMLIAAAPSLNSTSILQHHRKVTPDGYPPPNYPSALLVTIHSFVQRHMETSINLQAAILRNK